eukprot:g16088.t1
MFLRRYWYETVHDGDAAARPRTSPSVGAKEKAAVTLTLAIAALCSLSTFVVFDAPSNTSAGGGAVEPTGWQDLQPLDGETLTQFSRDLTSPEDRWSKDGELRTTLRVAPTVAQAGPLAPPLNVRAYEGSVPGPTLRVKPGDRLVVNLVNDLDLPEGDPSVAGAGEDGEGDGGIDRASLEGKVEAWPNVTNIHVHGLHVSPSGIGDNIYRRAGPGDALQYIYDLPPDHYPGIFYYHPHFEGSSSVQTLGGMSGAIIVEDAEGSLPPEVEAMREVVMVLQETNIESGALRNYKAASEISGSKMPLYGKAEGGNASESDLLHFITVNGQYQPVIRAQPGEALRLRVVHGGNNDHIHVSLVPAAAAGSQREYTQDSGQEKKGAAEASGPGDAPAANSDDDPSSCKLLTLARDGVYLAAPRLQGGGDGQLVLAAGSRADLAVRCDGPGVYRLVSSKGGAAGRGGGGDEDGDEDSIMAYLGKNTDVFEGTLAFLDVGGDQMNMKLPTKSPNATGENRLLQDLQELAHNEVSRFVFEFNAAEKVSRVGQTYTWYGINGVQYNASQVMRRVPLGSVEEWVIVNQRKGRGGEVEACHPSSSSSPPLPTTTPSTTTTATEFGEPIHSRGDVGGSAGGGDGGVAGGAANGEGQHHGRRKRRGLGSVLSEGPGVESGPSGRAVEVVEDEGEGVEAQVACESTSPGEVTYEGHPFHLHANHFEGAGPGEITYDSHPFHLHVNHFQVVSSSWGDEGPDWNVGDWRDTISIPAPGNVTIRWSADDFTGEAVAHCHIFGHSDTGMMMNFEIFETP